MATRPNAIENTTATPKTIIATVVPAIMTTIMTAIMFHITTKSNHNQFILSSLKDDCHPSLALKYSRKDLSTNKIWEE